MAGLLFTAFMKGVNHVTLPENCVTFSGALVAIFACKETSKITSNKMKVLKFMVVGLLLFFTVDAEAQVSVNISSGKQTQQ
ncbi:hypothetical protein [Prolixibacter bellariivorans]|nr:hypothetical protein [Prolixibacter bellariivorans]